MYWQDSKCSSLMCRYYLDCVDIVFNKNHKIYAAAVWCTGVTITIFSAAQNTGLFIGDLIVICKGYRWDVYRTDLRDLWRRVHWMACMVSNRIIFVCNYFFSLNKIFLFISLSYLSICPLQLYPLGSCTPIIYDICCNIFTWSPDLVHNYKHSTYLSVEL